MYLSTFEVSYLKYLPSINGFRKLTVYHFSFPTPRIGISLLSLLLLIWFSIIVQDIYLSVAQFDSHLRKMGKRRITWNFEGLYSNQQNKSSADGPNSRAEGTEENQRRRQNVMVIILNNTEKIDRLTELAMSIIILARLKT